MNLLDHPWIRVRLGNSEVTNRSPIQALGPDAIDLDAPRPDFRGALYQFLIGLLQIAYAPRDVQEWRDRYNRPPTHEELQAAFEPFKHAFLLENDGPAFKIGRASCRERV